MFSDYRDPYNTIQDGFALPPVPGQSLEEENRSYPTDPDTARMLASGTLVSAAALLGLKSFSDTGHLYGSLGIFMQDPVRSIRAILEYGQGLMQSGIQGAREQTSAALANFALNTNALHPEAMGRDELRSLAQRVADRQRVRKNNFTSQAFVVAQARIHGALTRASQGTNEGPQGFSYRETLDNTEQINLRRGELRASDQEILDNLPGRTGRHTRIPLINQMIGPIIPGDVSRLFPEAATVDPFAPHLPSQISQLIEVDVQIENYRTAYRSLLLDPAYANMGDYIDPDAADLETLHNLATADKRYKKLVERETRRAYLHANATVKPLYESKLNTGEVTNTTQNFRAGVLAKNNPNIVAPTIDDLAIPGLLGAGRNFSEIYDTRSGSLINEMVEKLNSKLINLSADAGGGARFSATIKNGSLQFEATVNNITKFSNIALPNVENGMLRDPRSGRMTATPAIMLGDTDLFGDSEANQLIDNTGRSRRILSATEYGLARALPLEQKFFASIQSGSPDEFLAHINRIFKDVYKESTDHTGSEPEMLRKAMMVDTVAGRRLRRFRDNAGGYADTLKDAVKMRNRFMNIMNSGHSVLAHDTEFISADIASEVGVKKSIAKIAGNLQYEYGGTVGYFDPNTGKMVNQATIEFFSDFLGQQSNDELEALKKKTRTDIERFQRGSAGKDTVEIDALFKKLMKGEVKIDVEGKAFSLSHANGRLQDADGNILSWAPTKRKDESLDKFVLRVKNAMAEHYDVRATFGHNQISSDLSNLHRMAEIEGVALGKAFDMDNAIDSYPWAQMHATDGTGSLSLGSLTAQQFGLNEREYLKTLDMIQTSLAGQDGVGARTQALNDLLNSSALQASSTNVMVMRRQQAQRNLISKMIDLVPAMPETVRIHTAALDSFMSFQFTLPSMFEREESFEGRQMFEQTLDLLNTQGNAGNVRGYLQKYGNQYLGDDDGDFSPFLGTPTDSSLGIKSAMRMTALTFNKLVSPVRQLYQRLKPRELLNPIDIHRGMDTGGKVPVIINGQVQMTPARIYGGSGLLGLDQLKTQSGVHNTNVFAFETIAGIIAEDSPSVQGSAGVATQAVGRAAMVGTKSKKEANINTLQLSKRTKEIGDELIADILDDTAGAIAVSKKGPIEDALRKKAALIAVLEDKSVQVSPQLKKIVIQQLQDIDDEILYGIGKTDVEPSTIETRTRQMFATGEQVDGTFKLNPKGMLLESASNVGDIDPGERLLFENLKAPADTFAFVTGVDVDLQTGTVRMNYLSAPTGIFKGLMQGAAAKAGMQSVTGQISATGEQFFVGDGSASAKRKDLAGVVMTSINRLRAQASTELSYHSSLLEAGTISQAQFAAEAAKIEARFVSSMQEIAGPDSKKLIELAITGSPQDRINFYPDDTLMDRISYHFTPGAMSRASAKMGLTFQARLEEINAVSGSNQTLANRYTITTYANQYADTIEGMAKQMEVALNIHSSKLADPNAEAAARTEIDRFKSESAKIREAVKSANPEDALRKMEDFGVLYDPIYDLRFGVQSLGQRALTSTEIIDKSWHARHNMGYAFEASTGRATKKKQTSALSNILMVHASRFGAETTEQGDASEWFRAYLGGEQGASQFSQKKLETEAARVLAPLLAKEKRILGSTGNKLTDLIEWDPDERAFKLKVDVGGLAAGEVLDINPFTTLTNLSRARVGFVRALTGRNVTERVSGLEIGSADRTVKVVPGKTAGPGEITADEFNKQYGRNARIDAQLRLNPGVDSAGNPLLQSDVLTGVDKDGIRKGGRRVYIDESNPLAKKMFDPRRADFISIDRHAGLSEEAVNNLIKQMKAAGADEAVIDRLFGNKRRIADGLLAGMISKGQDITEASALIESYIRGSSDLAPSQITMPIVAKQEMLDPQSKQTSVLVTREFAAFTEKMDHYKAITDVIGKVKELAEGPDPKALSAYLKTLSNPESGMNKMLLNAAEQLDSIQQQSMMAFYKQVAVASREATKTYLGGQYKVARSQMDLMPNLKTYAGLFEADPTKALSGITSLVESSLEEQGILRGMDTKKRSAYVSNAAESIHSYVGEQFKQHGTAVYKYQGFGVGEGFTSTTVAKNTLEEAKNRAEYYKILKDQTQESLTMQGSQKAHLQNIKGDADAIALRVETHLQSLEVAKEGKGGVMDLFTGRQPDFANSLPYTISRSTVLRDEAYQAMGVNINQVHLTSGFAEMFVRREDLDWDINFQMTVKDPYVAAQMSDNLAQINRAASIQLLATASLAARDGRAVDGPAYIKDANGHMRLNIEHDKASGRYWFKQTDELFEQNSELGTGGIANFVAKGSGLFSVMDRIGADAALSSQQTLVGMFGRDVKQASFALLSADNAFSHGVERIAELTQLGDAGLSAAERLYADADFHTARGQHILGGRAAIAHLLGLEDKKQTTLSESNSANLIDPMTTNRSVQRTQAAYVMDVFKQNMAVGLRPQQDLTQELSIEKYKGKAAYEQAYEGSQFLDFLSGRRSKYKDVYSAVDGMLEFQRRYKPKTDIRTAFLSEDDLTEMLRMQDVGKVTESYTFMEQRLASQEVRERMIESFALQRDLAVSARAMGNLGMEDVYNLSGTNASISATGFVGTMGYADPTGLHASNPAARQDSMTQMRGMEEDFRILSERVQDSAFVASDIYDDVAQVSRSSSHPNSRSVLNNIPVGGRAAALMLGGAVLLAATTGRLENRADGEIYDTPFSNGSDRHTAQRPRRGTPQTSARRSELLRKHKQEQAYYQLGPASTAQQYSARPVPTQYASY